MEHLRQPMHDFKAVIVDTYLYLTRNDIFGKRLKFLELVVPDLQLVELAKI